MTSPLRRRPGRDSRKVPIRYPFCFKTIVTQSSFATSGLSPRSGKPSRWPLARHSPPWPPVANPLVPRRVAHMQLFAMSWCRAATRERFATQPDLPVRVAHCPARADCDSGSRPLLAVAEQRGRNKFHAGPLCPRHSVFIAEESAYSLSIAGLLRSQSKLTRRRRPRV